MFLNDKIWFCAIFCKYVLKNKIFNSIVDLLHFDIRHINND